MIATIISVLLFFFALKGSIFLFIDMHQKSDVAEQPLFVAFFWSLFYSHYITCM